MPTYWIQKFVLVCGILARWSAHRLRLFLWRSLCAEHHDGRDCAGPFTGHMSPVTSVAFSPDGQRVVSSACRSVRMLDVTTGKTETTGQADFTDQSDMNDEGWIR